MHFKYVSIGRVVKKNCTSVAHLLLYISVFELNKPLKSSPIKKLNHF